MMIILLLVVVGGIFYTIFWGLRDTYPKPAREPIPGWMRNAVYDKARFSTDAGVDAYMCTYCHRIAFRPVGPDGFLWEVDHIYPVSRGGATVLDNLTLACHTCNQHKGADLLI